MYLSVSEGKVLIWKLSAVDGSAACSVVIGKVAALQHEPGYHSVKCASSVSETFLACKNKFCVM